jgi:L-ascorbate metabolism protein UlaG (beta-lactamase superfamily)
VRYHARVTTIRWGVPPLLAVLAGFVAGCAGGLARPDASLFPPPPRDAITFWGHACCYVDVGGIGIVTDPVFERGIVFRHRSIAGPPASSYAGARYILISHAHPDHLSPETLRTFPSSAMVLCPAPSEKYLRDVGLEVRAMAPGDEIAFEGGRIVAVAAFHMGSRWGVRAQADGRALGYVVETEGATIYYSGDTNYFTGLANVGWTYEPDVVLLNVNGHLHSDDASRAAWATRAAVVIPIHWGAFPYWIFGGNHRPRDEAMLRRVVGDRLRVLEVGQSVGLGTVLRPARAVP